MAPDDDRSADDEIISDASQTTRPAPRGKIAETAESWGRYRLVRRLGAGGFGSVYCAWDPKLERNIAIKILHQQVADDRLQERLLLEGRALAKVQHANVVQVFELEAHGSRVGLCMELVSGETLSDVLRSRGPMDPGEAAVVGEDVCRALAAVHAAGYVHRDVKAQNVMRDKGGKIVLMDFGAGHATAGSHAPHDLTGTPVYMAPELLDGQPASVQSDIYAVGVLLYHLVTGHYPVEGGKLPDLIEVHRSGGVRSLAERRPELPRSFAGVVSRALAADPAARWASAEAMLQALSELRSGPFLWIGAIPRVVAVSLAGTLGLTALGAVSSRYFNVVLGRDGFVSEGPGDWLYWGAVSAVAPAVLVLMVLVGLAVLRVSLRALLWLWPGGRKIGDALSRVLHRLGLDSLDAISAAALVTSVGVLAVACWSVLDDLGLLFNLISPNIVSAPIESLAYLSPGNSGQHDRYRLSFESACIILVALWRVPFRMAANRGLRVNASMQSGAAAVLLLTLVLLEFPYRLMYQAEFDAIEWQGQQCSVLGERDDAYLLFCRELEPPRTRLVKKDAGDLELVGTKMNPFGSASPPPP